MENKRKGNYTAYLVPPAQSEGSGVFMSDDLEELKGLWYGAIAIFETPNMTVEHLKEIFNTPQQNAELGSLLKFLRKNFKVVHTDGAFYFE
jgi:hypothetical protein